MRTLARRVVALGFVELAAGAFKHLSTLRKANVA